MTMPNVLYNGPGNWPDADKLMANYNYLESIATAYTSFRNRIINGDMRIDQRNAGAAVTVNSGASDTYSVDRWHGGGQSTDGVFTLQQSTTAPSGFNYSIKATVTTADSSIGATQTYNVRQNIEGNNVIDFGLGTALGKSMTLSFWVRSSLTGTFGGAFLNSSGSRACPFSYSISAANTWEYKTFTVACDTTGTWLTDTGRGVQVVFSLGTGSTYVGTSGTWAASQLYGVTGQTNLIATNGATLYITGVQLELGTVATPFEFYHFTNALQHCQRYYEKSYALLTAPGTVTNSGRVIGSRQNGNFSCYTSFRVIKNASPTVAIYSPATGTIARIRNDQTAADETVTTEIGTSGFNVSGTTSTAGHALSYHYTAEAEI